MSPLSRALAREGSQCQKAETERGAADGGKSRAGASDMVALYCIARFGHTSATTVDFVGSDYCDQR